MAGGVGGLRALHPPARLGDCTLPAAYARAALLPVLFLQLGLALLLVLKPACFPGHKVLRTFPTGHHQHVAVGLPVQRLGLACALGDVCPRLATAQQQAGTRVEGSMEEGVGGGGVSA